MSPRYYFPGWYSGGASRAYRYGVGKGSESPVFDDSVMSYLFSQVRCGWQPLFSYKLLLCVCCVMIEFFYFRAMESCLCLIADDYRMKRRVVSRCKVVCVLTEVTM